MEINENSTYEEAFKVSERMIKRCWKWFPFKNMCQYDDLYQECALVFWCKLKPKYSPLDACNIVSKAYKWATCNFIKQLKRYLCLFYDDFKSNKYILQDKNIEDDFKGACDYNLKKTDQNICNLLEMGFNIREIGNKLKLSSNTIQQHICNIRKILTNQYDIKKKTYRKYHWMKDTSFISGKNHHSSKAVACYKDNIKINEFGSVREAARELNITPSGAGICNAIKNHTKCKGYEWRYV